MVEIDPGTQDTAPAGKSDPIDAEAAARAALTGAAPEPRNYITARSKHCGCYASLAAARSATRRCPTPDQSVDRDRLRLTAQPTTRVSNRRLIQVLRHRRPTGPPRDPAVATVIALTVAGPTPPTTHRRDRRARLVDRPAGRGESTRPVRAARIGPDVAGQLLVTAGQTRTTHSRGRVRHAVRAGPTTASSGPPPSPTQPRRPTAKQRALYRITLSGCAGTADPGLRRRRTTEGRAKKRSSDASNATSPARSTPHSPAQKTRTNRLTSIGASRVPCPGRCGGTGVVCTALAGVAAAPTATRGHTPCAGAQRELTWHTRSTRVPRRDGVCRPPGLCASARTLCWRSLCAGGTCVPARKLVCRPGGCQPALRAKPRAPAVRAPAGRHGDAWSVATRRVRPSRPARTPRTGHRVRPARCGCPVPRCGRRRAQDPVRPRRVASRCATSTVVRRRSRQPGHPSSPSHQAAGYPVAT